MNSADRKELKRLWRAAAEETYGPFLPAGAGRESRYGVVKYVGVIRGEDGRRYQVCTTGDSKYYLYTPLYGDTSITWGDSFPVLKSSLSRALRSALANGRPIMPKQSEQTVFSNFKFQIGAQVAHATRPDFPLLVIGRALVETPGGFQRRYYLGGLTDADLCVYEVELESYERGNGAGKRA